MEANAALEMRVEVTAVDLSPFPAESPMNSVTEVLLESVSALPPENVPLPYLAQQIFGCAHDQSALRLTMAGAGTRLHVPAFLASPGDAG